MAKYVDVHPENPQPRLIEQVADAVRDDALIAYPTDSGYALGTRLGVTAEDDPEDPAVQADGGRLLYHWLTWFQDALVAAVLRT